MQAYHRLASLLEHSCDNNAAVAALKSAVKEAAGDALLEAKSRSLLIRLLKR